MRLIFKKCSNVNSVQCLWQVLDKVAALQAEFDKMNQKKIDLENKIEQCKMKLIRAEQLITGLGGEKTR